MPAVPAIVSKSSKVLVTGASGFIATQLCDDLLQRGYTVVGTVRSADKGEYLRSLYNNRRFSYFIVEDNEAPDAFDEAVKGDFDAVLHTSSPFRMHAAEPSDLIGPAVKGTLSVLEAVKKNAPTVKRIIVTSSTAAVIYPNKPDYTFTENDWNEWAPAEVERMGRDTPGVISYIASKTLAERAAWKFVEDEKSSIGFDLVTINPPMVFGPPSQPVKSLESLNTSIAAFNAAMTDPSIYNDVAKTSEQYFNFVDVRDVSEAHILALENEQAGGERFIVSNAPYILQDFYNALNAAGVPGIPTGFPNGPQPARSVQSGAKAEKMLGLKYRSLEETAVDTIKSLRARFPQLEPSAPSAVHQEMDGGKILMVA